MKSLRARSGFSLLEISIVLAILAIIAGGSMDGDDGPEFGDPLTAVRRW